jgi:xanthine/uracil permease
MTKWYLISAAIGIVSGYAYYYYIGCVTGTCPIQTNPWLSMTFGGVFGMALLPDVFGWLERKRTNENEQEQPNP